MHVQESNILLIEGYHSKSLRVPAQRGEHLAAEYLSNGILTPMGPQDCYLFLHLILDTPLNIKTS